MAWSTPLTWTFKYIPTFAVLNAEIRDRFNLLKTDIADDGTSFQVDTVTHAGTPYTFAARPNGKRFLSVDASGGVVTAKLPASPTTDDLRWVSKRDSSASVVTVDGNGKNINGAATFLLSAQYDHFGFKYNGTEWMVL